MKYLFQSILFPLRLFVVYITALSIFLHILIFNRPKRGRKKKQPPPGIAPKACTLGPDKASAVCDNAEKGRRRGFIEIMPIHPSGCQQNMVYHRKSGRYSMCFSPPCTPENCSLHGHCTSSEEPQNTVRSEPSDGAPSASAEDGDALSRESLADSGSLAEEHSDDASSQGYGNSICSEEPSDSVFLDEPEDREPPSPKNSKARAKEEPVSVHSGQTEVGPFSDDAGQSRKPKRASPGEDERPSPRTEVRRRGVSSEGSSSPEITVLASERLFLSHSQAGPYSAHSCADPLPHEVCDTDAQAMTPPKQAEYYAISDEPGPSALHSVSAARQASTTDQTTTDLRDAAAEGGETAERYP